MIPLAALALPLLSSPLPASPAASATPRLLVVDNFVIGEFRGGAWHEVTAETPRSKTYGRATWYPVGPTSTKGTPLTRGTKIETDGYVGVFLTGADTNPDGVYLSGARPVQPRRIEALPTTNATYRGVVRRWLDAKGMRRSPVRIKRLLRADLDGDGTKEILIEARSADDMPAIGFDRKPNGVDYALVLLRATRGGKVVELPLSWAKADGPEGSSGQSTIRAVADLDGDRRMEIVLDWSAWEVHAAEVHAYRAGTERSVLQNGAAL